MVGLNCIEVAPRLVNDEITGIRWPDRVRVGFHLFLCDKWRLYNLQLEVISKAVKDLWPKPDDEVRLRLLEQEVLKNSGERGEANRW